MEVVTEADFCRFAPGATRESLERALRAPAASRNRTVTLMLEATQSAFDADVRGAIALLRRALASAKGRTSEAAYIEDAIAPYYVSVGDFASLRDLQAGRGDVPIDVRAPLMAVDAVLSSVYGDTAQTRAIARDAIACAELHDDPSVRGRTLSRCAIAAYYSGDFDLARERALETARVFEQSGGYASAAIAYSVAGSVAWGHVADGRMAASFYSRMSYDAKRSGHRALYRTALAACRMVAAETGDVSSFDRYTAELMREPTAQQHQERFCLLTADTLGYGWSGRFAMAEATLERCLEGVETSVAQRALVDALRSITALAHGDVDRARSLARGAARQSGRAARHAPLHDVSDARRARLIAAYCSFALGDGVRAQRMLSRRFDPDGRNRALLSKRRIDLDRCSEMFRGFAMYINKALAQCNDVAATHGLTPAEVDVMRAAAHGDTVRELAQQLGKSRHTVARQLESIYVKLNARNRTQAVHQARELGLLP